MLTYRYFEKLCKYISENFSISSFENPSFNNVLKTIYIKHDVECKPKKALRIAKIEYKYHIVSTFYVQAYLMNKKNLNCFKAIEKMGHRISYHHDVMDYAHGDIKIAREEFQKNIELFHNFGFSFKTVCQHGNPLIQRIGYNSNRDFFRDNSNRQKYIDLKEIMLDLPSIIGEPFVFVSDAGRQWKWIRDPLNGDLQNSDKHDIKINDIFVFLKNNADKGPYVISSHPHRFANSSLFAFLKTIIFSIIKVIAKVLYKIPIFKKIFSKYYYLAKKI